MLQSRKVDNEIEKILLTAMITRTEVLTDVVELWDAELVEIPFVSIVGGWCLEYYKEFSKAPGLHIQDIFYDKRDHGLTSSLADEIEDFLSLLDSEYLETIQNQNSKYILKQAHQRFKKQALKRLSDDIQDRILGGDIGEAEDLVSTYAPPELDTGDLGICPYTDEKAIQEAFEYAPEPLVKFPGALGEFWNDQFVPDSLISILAPEKRGKSWHLWDIASRGVRYGLDVAFFQVGDMSRRQMILRAATHITQRHYKPKYCGRRLIPVLDCVKNQNGKCDNRSSIELLDWSKWQNRRQFYELYPEHIPCTDCFESEVFSERMQFRGGSWFEEREVSQLHWQESLVINQRFVRRCRGRIRMFTYPNDTMNVAGIRRVLNKCERKFNFCPKLIVIDYADILAPEPGFKYQFRHLVNQTWKALRALSQERECCVVTATQADAASSEQRSLGIKNFSEDKRKRSHVTAEFALNQLSEEKRQGIMRIGSVLLREDEFDTANEVSVLYDLSIGRPVLKSFFNYF